VADEIRELWRLEQLDREISRKESLTTNGYARSAVEDELDARTRRVLPRHDQVAREATKLVLLFLRQLFSDHKQITWKGSNGTTDADSDIVIESVFADRGVDRDLEKPTLIVRPGPRSSQDISVGNIKHHDVFLSGTKTVSYVDVGTMQILVHAGLPTLAQDIVEFVHKALKMPDCPLLFRGFIKIENISSAGYDRDNPSYNRSTEKRTHVALPLTFTYYWQSTMRSRPRDNQYEMATTMASFLKLRDEPVAAPFVDGSRDSVIESGGTLLLIPLDPDED
jgi:hypothetical protein